MIRIYTSLAGGNVDQRPGGNARRPRTYTFLAG